MLAVTCLECGSRVPSKQQQRFALRVLVRHGAMSVDRIELPHMFRLAAIAGSVAALRIHVARTRALNCVDKEGRTALMLAASRGREDACRMLLEAGADPSLRDATGESAMSL